MGLHKGMTNNRKGRKPGVLNKMNQDLRQKITDFLESRWPDIQKAFDKLSPKEKVTFYRELLQYRLPKLESISISEIDFESFSNEELDEMINKLKKVYGKAGQN